jgi:hypothetical protein
VAVAPLHTRLVPARGLFAALPFVSWGGAALLPKADFLLIYSCPTYYLLWPERSEPGIMADARRLLLQVTRLFGHPTQVTSPHSLLRIARGHDLVPALLVARSLIFAFGGR